METELTLEYGKKLKATRVIHQELLCCQSEKAARIFKEAQPLRAAYAAIYDLRKDLKELVCPRVTKDDFDDQNLEVKAILLIMKIYDRCPLRTYQKNIQSIVDDLIVVEVGRRHVVTQSKTPFAKKDLPGMGIQLRLQALQSKGVLAVAQGLSDHLRQIKHKEKEAAKTDIRKAAAQRRWIVPDTEDHVVRSLVQWLYCAGSLKYDDAEHLYALHVLAVTLGMTQLAEKCLSTLSRDSQDMIEDAFCQGTSLQQLLRLSSETQAEDGRAVAPTKNVVEVVFEHVLNDVNPPKRLFNLVVSTLAEHLDTDLWLKLAPRTTLPMSIQIISTILIHRQVKTENFEGLRLKSESVSTGDELLLYAPNKQTASGS